MTKRISTSQIVLVFLVLLIALVITIIIGGNELGVVQDKPVPTTWEYEEVHTSTIPAATLVTHTPSLRDTLPSPPERVEKPNSTPSLTPTTEDQKNDD
jgi:hypothetical protein